MGVLFLLMPLVLCLSRVLGADVDPALPFSEYLDSGSSVLLRWGFDLVKDSIMFELSVKTTGWVGFGFSPNGGMEGADIVIGGVGPDGIYFTDRHAAGKFMPLLDEQQDYRLLSLTEADGQTVMKFERSIRACDKDDYPITEVPVKLIYAYGKTDNITYHRTSRGTKEVNLLKFMPKSMLPDSNYFDLTMTNFTIPTENTYYHCKVMKTPLLDQKYHVYRIEPLIENMDLVHHLLLYRCPPTVTSPTEEACYTGETQTQCFQTVAAWGVGGGAFELPEVAGIPVGGDDGKTLYRLEVHYNNQDNIAGRVDNSGLRFYYTSQLRQYDAAVLMTGLAVVPGYVIPPNTTNFHSYGVCDTSQVSQVISDPAADLHVFSVILHTHLAGKKIRVGHFRNGEQIDLLAMDEHYNFEFQQAVNLGKTKTVKLGDQLLVECTYNTENRTGLTLGGLATTNEMCLAFLFYYPAMSLSSCVSFPDPQILSHEMGAANEIEWLQMMFLKHWDEVAIDEYEKTLTEIQQYLIVGNIANNVSSRTGLIPQLKAAPPVSCIKRNSSNITHPSVGLMLLLWITALLILS